jgi:rSAM/selenodomain-associated transferase 1
MAVRSMSARVVVMTKLPEAGKVKTRLIPAIGAQGAAALHRAMLLDTLSKIESTGLHCTVCTAGSPDHPLRAELARLGLKQQEQASGDLGERLHHATQGAGRVIVLGSDSPCFEPAWLVAAAAHTSDLSLGPAEDGGYWAIGLTAEARRVVFSRIDWSTEHVHAQTLQRATDAGLRTEPIPLSYDIDRPEDLPRLRRDPRCPPRTLAVLKRLLTTSP